MFMSQRLNAIIPDQVFEKLLGLSEQEKRTKSQMAAILIEEAITARERDALSSKKPKTVAEQWDELKQS